MIRVEKLSAATSSPISIVMINRRISRTNCQVVSTKDLWTYMDRDLVPSIHSTFKYNGDSKTWRERVFLADDVSYRVGPMRLRQLRLKPGMLSFYVYRNKAKCCRYILPLKRNRSVQSSVNFQTHVSYIRPSATPSVVVYG